MSNNSMALRPGSVARINGLLGRRDLNDQQCCLLHWNERTGRWAVKLTDERVLIKPENLLLPNKPPQIRPQDVRG